MAEEFYLLPEATQLALLEGYILNEVESRSLHWQLRESVTEEILRTHPIAATQPEAFADGTHLRYRIGLIFSADHPSEYKEDLASYAKLAERMNKVYGDIVIPQDDDNYRYYGYHVLPNASLADKEAWAEMRDLRNL
jgi:hypothetical protein